MDFLSLIKLDVPPDISLCGYARAGNFPKIQAWALAQSQNAPNLGHPALGGDVFSPNSTAFGAPSVFSGPNKGPSTQNDNVDLSAAQRAKSLLNTNPFGTTPFENEDACVFEDVFSDIDGAISRAAMEAVWGLAETEAPQPQHSTALMHAARHGHADCVAALLPFSDAKAQTTRGLTALHLAAAHGHIECVKLLLPCSDPKAAVSVRDFSGMTALAMGVVGGHADCVHALLAHFDANAIFCWSKHEGFTPVLVAALFGRLDCARILAPVSRTLTFDDSRAPMFFQGITALHLSAMTGSLSCVEFFLSLCDARAVLANGESALFFAAQMGHADCVSALLPHSDANQRTGDALRGDTALHTAVRHRRLDCARVLLSAANPDALNDEGATPLFLACSRYPVQETDPLHGIMEISSTLGDGSVGDFVRLLAPVSDAAARDSERSLTPLLALCAVDGWLRRPDFDAEALDILVRRSEGHATDDEGCTALMLAARSGNLAATQAIAPISSVNARDHDTYSALSLALLFQHEEIALFLLSLPDIDIYGAESTLVAPLSRPATRAPGDPPSVSAVSQSAMAGRLASHQAHGGHGGAGAPFAPVSLSIGRRSSASVRVGISKQAPSAAIFAANHGFTDVLRVIFTLDPAEIQRFDGLGSTPLMHAVRQQRFDSIRFLLPLSDANARGPDGETVFDLALRHKSPDCLRLILPAVDLRARNPEGDTPLARAIAGGARDESCLAILAATPRDAVDCVNKKGLTAFLIAVEADRITLLRPLAAAGNPMTAGPGIENALSIGVKSRNLFLIDLVLEHAPEHLAENAFMLAVSAFLPRGAARVEAMALAREAGLPAKASASEEDAPGAQSPRPHSLRRAL